jgi:hypothetical protein
MIHQSQLSPLHKYPPLSGAVSLCQVPRLCLCYDLVGLKAVRICAKQSQRAAILAANSNLVSILEDIRRQNHEPGITT